MNGPHDMGGMHGFGPVLTEENTRHARARWELRMHALMRAARSHQIYNIDEFRHAIERMPPAEYLGSSYYERWLSAIERLLIEKAVLDEREVRDRLALLQERPDATFAPLQPPKTGPGAGQSGVPTTPPVQTEPRFRPGDAVRARNQHPVGHTRLPRYVRGKRGTIHRLHGVHVFPDTHAHGQGEQAHPLYSVRFEADELWSASADGRGAVYVDLWEAYLEPAAG
jgi:nitrile hydratase